jgi:hypothetical protein
MDIEDSRKIYLDPNARGIAYEPEEWELSGAAFARHLPTSTIWEIDFDRVSSSGGTRLEDWFVRLVHVCDHRYKADEGLDDGTMEFIGRGALAFYLQAIGAWKPEIVDEPDTPEQAKIRQKYLRLGD